MRKPDNTPKDESHEASPLISGGIRVSGPGCLCRSSRYHGVLHRNRIINSWAVDAMRRSVLGLCFIPFVVAACVPLPIPYKRTSVPEVYGRLTEHAAPVPGAHVAYSVGLEADACSEPQYETATDANGKFSFEREWSWWPVFIPLLPFHCVSGWSLCISPPQVDSLSWSGSSYGPCFGAPAMLALDCELTRTEGDPIPGLSTPFHNEPLCRYRNLPSHEPGPERTEPVAAQQHDPVRPGPRSGSAENDSSQSGPGG